MGTLWVMADGDAFIMAREFYGYIFRHGDTSKVGYRICNGVEDRYKGFEEGEGAG